jgi:hypothetical protein
VDIALRCLALIPPESMLLCPLAGYLDVMRKELGMSVVAALSLVLFVGFVGTGLVGFLRWRQRMRDGARFSVDKLRTIQTSTR